MNITKVEIRKHEVGPIKGYATINIEVGDFTMGINGLTIISGQNGDFVRFPQRAYTNKDGEKKYTSDIFFTNEDPEVVKAAYKVINDTVLEAFNNAE